jgi:sec-independent protein translocase protein TatA
LLEKLSARSPLARLAKAPADLVVPREGDITMFGLSLGHIVILSVVVLLFGSRRLPELGAAMGKGMHAFKKGLSGEEDLDPTPARHEAMGTRNPDAVLPPSNKNA